MVVSLKRVGIFINIVAVRDSERIDDNADSNARNHVRDSESLHIE